MRHQEPAIRFFLFIFLLIFPLAGFASGDKPHHHGSHHRHYKDRHHGKGLSVISGKVRSSEKEVIDYAVVYLEGTEYSSHTDERGAYRIFAPAGDYKVVVSAVGYKRAEKNVGLGKRERERLDFTLEPENLHRRLIRKSCKILLKHLGMPSTKCRE